jgi:hypothetical protein
MSGHEGIVGRGGAASTIFVLRTNVKITPLRALLRYRDLQKVENLFLRTKAVMRTRPISADGSFFASSGESVGDLVPG